MENSQRAYRAVCFDLDGTLLPMELDEFLEGYFKALTRFMAERGADPRLFQDALNSGTFAMAKHKDPVVNASVFWQVFTEKARVCDVDPALWQSLFEEFYETKFGSVGDDVVPSAAMVAAVEELRRKGYPVVLLTMPLFPQIALEWRLKWAGLDASQFARLTTYENSTAAKPSLRYYAENLAAMDLAGTDVLMVGNNTVEDLSFRELGADAFLVTDHIIDPVELDLDTVRHGSAEDFLAFVQALPACENPAGTVSTDVIDPAATEAAIAANLCASEERLAEMAEEAKAAAAVNLNAGATAHVEVEE